MDHLVIRSVLVAFLCLISWLPAWWLAGRLLATFAAAATVGAFLATVSAFFASALAFWSAASARNKQAKYAGYLGTVYGTTSWAFGHDRPAPSHRLFRRFLEGERYTNAEAAWQAAVNNAWSNFEKQVVELQRKLKEEEAPSAKETLQSVLKQEYGDTAQSMATNLLEAYTSSPLGEMDRFDEIRFSEIRTYTYPE